MYYYVLTECIPVTMPGRQRSHVISRSLRSWGRSSGANASAVKEPGHFEVRKSSSQVTGCTFFLKKVYLFSDRQRRWFFHCQNKTNKAVRYMILFTLLPKQSNRQGRARAVDLPARSFDLARPGVAPPLRTPAGKILLRSVFRSAHMLRALSKPSSVHVDEDRPLLRLLSHQV